MKSITLANATTRTTVIVDEQQTIKDVLSSNGFSVEGVTVHANGVPQADLNKTLAQAGVDDGAMLMSVPYQKAGFGLRHNA